MPKDTTPTTYQQLEQLCIDAGTNITEVCREAGINRGTLDKWRNAEPNTLQILSKFVETLKRLDARTDKPLSKTKVLDLV